MSTDFKNLDQLTEQLYSELIAKSEAEIQQQKAISLKELEDHKQKAKEEIDAYREEAKKTISQERMKMEAELRLKADVLLEELKLKLKDLLATEMVSKPLAELFSDTDFIKEYVFSLAAQIHQSSASLSLSLSADGFKDWQQQLEKQFPGLTVTLGAGKQEIKILNNDEGYYFSMGEQELKNLFLSYLDESLKARLNNE
jgi:F0F1-type ATP synthase membrane subunit b/b'